MDWNGNQLLRPLFNSRPESSFNFLYNYDQYPGTEMKHHQMVAQPPHAVVPMQERNNFSNQLEKKKRLTSGQLDSLESCFQEDIKLDPDRKMKLAQELGLQPRQVAVWFQNRRARWKAKQLERLYDDLKQQFDVVSREKQKLQSEVMELRAVLKEQATTKKHVSTGYTEVSGEETVESTSVGIRSCNKQQAHHHHHQQQIRSADNCNYVFNVDDYNPVMPPYWSVLPSYP
ncbi:hypothetical protein RJ640_017246 [Escallonia rubra]|uniref:Homeobox-leucine zipper protein n=1 Tax=Escallonia rubra TaxID=112253 RepID=A0AA88UJM9_9ASTE|nr:hypothetical protein RJ640_017246 [Escallonia rubra]